jgi:hypothetical protein
MGIGLLAPFTPLLLTRPCQQDLCLVGDFLRVGLPLRPAKSLKDLCRVANLCGVAHGQMAKVELRGGGNNLLLQEPSALTNKAPYRVEVELSRAVLMQTLHERSVDRRQTLIQAKSKSSQVAQKIFLSSSYADPSGPSMFLRTRPGRGIRR